MNLFSLGSASWFKETINLLMLWLCDMLYKIIGLLYQVFVSITQVNLFDRETFTQITRNMYVVMGIAMLFIFAYNIVLMIINPDDKKSTGSTTKVVKETIISLVLVILLPTIFNWMYVFQNNIINSGIITSIILNNVGSNDNVDISCNYSDYGFDNYATYSGTGIIKGQGSFGVDNKIDEITQECNKFNTKTQKFKSLKGAYLVAPTILSAFYRPTNFTYDDCVTFVEQNHASGDFGTDDDKQICINYYYDVEYSKLSGDTSKFTKDKYLINSATDDTKEGMELNALFAIVSGVIAAIMYFSYCIEIGVRVAKLGVLQIVSPIAVMLRIVPKQKEAFFDKWFKNVKDTYLDVFIRLLIINFALFAVSLIPGVIKTLFSSIGDIDSNGVIKALATVFIILGILQFGKECPDLIKEFFGNSGRFSVKGGLKKLKENPLTNATRASVYGATTGKGFGGVVGGALSGAIRGATGGYDKAVKGIDKIRTEKANGSTLYGRTLDRARLAVGMETVADADERRANREVEGKWHITERMKRNDEAMKNAKKIKSTVKDALNKEDTKQTYDVNGVTGNLYQLHKYEEGLYQAISGAKTDTEKAKAYQAYQQFQSRLVEVEKKAVNDVVSNALKAKTQTELQNLNDNYNIKGVDVGTIQSAANAIVSEASKGALGVEYDKDGKEIAGTGWKENSIDDAATLGRLMGALGNESAQLAQHSQKDFGENYDRHVANRNVVKKQGNSEKK